jgi:hypothetical protein
MWRSPPDSLSVAVSLHHALSFAMFDAADPAFFAWASYTIPRDTPRVSGWAQQRLALVSSGTAVGQRCYRGDLVACRIALLLAPEADPVLTWHDSVTRRRLVRRHGALARRRDQNEERRCLAGSDAACIAVLQQFPPSAFREPGASALRVGFLKHALAVGGPGAIERLLGVHTSPAGRLEAAARQPLDSVIGSWQARVKHTRAPSEDLTIGITMVSLLWTTAIGALALRSSRWR